MQHANRELCNNNVPKAGNISGGKQTSYKKNNNQQFKNPHPPQSTKALFKGTQTHSKTQMKIPQFGPKNHTFPTMWHDQHSKIQTFESNPKWAPKIQNAMFANKPPYQTDAMNPRKY